MADMLSIATISGCSLGRSRGPANYFLARLIEFTKVRGGCAFLQPFNEVFGVPDSLPSCFLVLGAKDVIVPDLSIREQKCQGSRNVSCQRAACYTILVKTADQLRAAREGVVVNINAGLARCR